MAHLALSLFMFTACRIGDAIWLGRAQEEKVNGALWLRWQPTKKGSAEVHIPMLPPLLAATRAQPIRAMKSDVYLLTEKGVPFSSPKAPRNRLQKWCAQAGIEGRSAHGIRKAAGHLLAINGATQYEIMTVHGHANARTSEVHTKAVEKMRLGEFSASRLTDVEW